MKSVISRKNLWVLGVLTIALMLGLALFAGSTDVLAADPVVLTIKGDGVNNTVTFTRAELEALAGETVQTYSSANTFPTSKLLLAQGVSLKVLLDKAGLKAGATKLKFGGADGYGAVFTIQELLNDIRYVYPDIMKGTTDGQKVIDTIVALKRTDGDTAGEEIKAVEPTLVMGQRYITEQTNPSFVKNIAVIEVLTDNVEQCPAPTVNFASGSVVKGTGIVLSCPLAGAKIYYTLDGSIPTLKSKLYNISTGWQPQLNKPIVVEGDITVKAVAVNAGMANSSVVTFTYVAIDAIVFKDLGGYDWAKPAIDDLVEKMIINGKGNDIFAPADSLLRSEFAKIMVLAMGYSVSEVTSSQFSDVGIDKWYAPYVEAAAKAGLIQGDGNGKFRPEDNVSKEEMVTVVVRAMGNKVEAEALSGSGLTKYSTLDTISPWARGYIEQAEKDGILEYGHIVDIVGDKYSFAGKIAASRAEAAVITYNMLNSK